MIMKTRHGKIARLPKEIREQLNRRIENGWRGARCKNQGLGYDRLKVDNGV